MSLLALLCPAALLLPQTEGLSQQQQAPNPPVRMIAEGEPALGAMIRWPLRVPDACVVEMAKDDTLFLLVDEKNETAARKKVEELELDPSHVQIVACSVVSEWPRDWGPHQLFDGDGNWCIVDQIFAGYPIYDREPKNGKPQMTIPTGPGDDQVNGELAAKYGAQLIPFPATLTGGNFLNDGHGTAFCTQALLDENRKHCDEATLRQLLKKHLGIHRLVVLENTEVVGLQHIDCWLKVLDAERLLVKRPPKGHNEEAAIERNLAKIAELNNAFGRPYEILRIDCPEVKVLEFDENDPIAAYTNSLILNGKVLVPLHQVDGDKDAIETWKKAMPGHEVIGFPWDRWLHFDALHCRSRAVFDRNLLRLEHARLPDPAPHRKDGHPITTRIRALSGADIDGEHCCVHYRQAGQDEWQATPLRLTSDGRWDGTLPAFAEGTRVEYYLEARDQKGQTRVHPFGAPRVAHTFTVQ